MKKQYFRRLLALAVTFVLLFAESAASAFYEPGGTSVSLGDIDLSAGTTSYEFNLTVDTKSLTFTAPASATVTLSTGQQTVTLTESGTVTFPQVERKGARCWEFTSEAPITLSNVVAVSYDNPELSGYDSTMEAPVCALSDNEMAVSTALLVNRNASCIIVGGARRYINYDDAKEVPAMIDGSMYLPGRALALALGCYYESIPGKNYVFIRDDEQAREFYFTTEGCYEQTERGEKLPIPFHPVYKEGNVYLPVRCFAELLGKTVAYRDGIAMVDDYYSVQKMQTSGVFSYINSLFAGFTPTEGTGNTYHVAQTASASDDNLGSFSQPWRTLKKAAAEAEAGDTVIIHKGVYREVLAPQNDGTATNPIIFRAAENEKVVISATKPVSGFTTREDGLLTAPVPVDLGEGRNQVFYNGACNIEARYPDGPGIEMSENGEALSDLFPVWGDMQVQDRTEEEKTAGITRVTSENLLQEEEADYWKGAFYLSVHGYSYALMPARVASSKKGELTLTDTEDLYWRYDPKTNKTWNFGYISGHINAINQPGEWVVQDGQLIIKPPAGETAATLQVEMKADQLTMDLTDREFVQVIGVETLGGSAKLKDSEMCVLS
ncbi:MAG: hypothetical protein IKL80_04085, partial [Clostridia bacterium]|nr:hypothetical protein [Clostridia bacterium]